MADLQVAWQRDPSSPANLNGVYNGPLGESTMGVYPTGWSGRIAVGRNSDPNVIQKGSVIEASFIDGSTTVDVSYVKGYSVPMYVFPPSLKPQSVLRVRNRLILSKNLLRQRCRRYGL